MTGRFDKPRRLAVARSLLVQMNPVALISYEVPLTEAPAIYEMIDRRPERVLQAIFAY